MAWTNILGQTRVGIRGAQAQVQTTSLLLDSYSGSAAAYSLRKLSGSYTGNAIRVRRSSDNTEQNIGFDAGGNLNTVALLAFVGSGNGFVTTWYDQSGNSINLIQATAAYQPKIVNSGSIINKNNKTSIDFTSGQYLRSDNRVIGLTETSVFNVFSIKSLTSRGVAWDIGKSDTSYNFYAFDINTYNTSGSKFGFYTSTTAFDSNISTNLNQNLISVISNNSSGNNIISNTTYYINNTLASLANTGGGSGAVYSSFSGANRITVGDFQNFPAPFSGTHQEIIFYQKNQSTNRLAISNNINTYYSIYASDTDAQSFVTAAGITDGTQINAINTLVTDLKTAGIWTKMKAIYPFVGGNATSHKFNLKDPRDLDAAYRLQFNGGWTHNSNGVTPNGSNGFARTFFVDTNLSINSVSYSIYNRSNTPQNVVYSDFGYYRMNSSYVSNYFATNYAPYGWGGRVSSWNSVSQTRTDYRGFYNGNRTNSTEFNFFLNGSKALTQNDNTSGKLQTGYQFHLGCLFIDGQYYNDWSTNNYAFAHISDGLTDTEASTFYTAVQKYQTTLGRAV
jgi:hypothetical protein